MKEYVKSEGWAGAGVGQGRDGGLVGGAWKGVNFLNLHILCHFELFSNF